MKQLLTILVLSIWITACQPSTEAVTTPSGVAITYVEKGEETDKLVSGNVVRMLAHYRTADNKDLIKTENGEPLPMQFDSAFTVDQNGLIQEVFEELRVGDSITCEIPSKNLWEVSFRRPLPDSIEASSNIKVDLRVVDQLSMQDYQAEMMAKEKERNASAYENEAAIMEQYLADNNISPETTASGLMYTITKNTDQNYPTNGQMVSVKYKGMLLNGNVFDEGTYTFPLGAGQVIAGWDEGIAMLRQGEQGILYIPSSLGYGSRGSGATIPPFSSLIFEVELLEIK